MDRISDVIRHRIQKHGGSFKSNDNIQQYLMDSDLDMIEQEVQEAFEQVLKSLVIDIENDHNTKETARRVAKMYCREIFKGRYDHSPRITAFPNTSGYDQLYVVGPIDVKSQCAHHFQNIAGKCWIGVFPDKEVIGLSKFNRVVDHYARRPQIQEELTTMIADDVEKISKAKGIAVVIKAEHHCVLARGVEAHESEMTTSIFRGELRTNASLKAEFLSLLATMKGVKN